jgi:hypothetical protein
LIGEKELWQKNGELERKRKESICCRLSLARYPHKSLIPT